MKSFRYQFDLITHLARRSFVLRYKGSTLGVLWSLLLPLFQLLILVFLFQKVVPLGIEAYPAFLFTGLLPWTWFSTCITSAGLLFTANRDLVRRPNFAPASLMLVETLSNLLTFLASLPILFILLVVYARPVTLSLVMLPVLLLIECILIGGLGIIIATLNVFFRDINHIMSVVITLLFYLTPVFYRSEAAGKRYGFIYTLNPVAVLIKSYRAILFYGTYPEWGPLLFAAIASLAILALGYLVYARRIHEVVDEL
jgi:lipopolysaccharide transport system permease protein